MIESTKHASRVGAAALTAVVGGILSGGCGLISSDVANFDLTLPAKEFSIDASAWQVDQTQADLLFSTSCGGMPTACAQAAMAACADDCTGTCSASTQRCELALDVSLYRPIDLLNEKPELKSINDEPLISVTIDKVTFEVTANTLNVNTPEMTVYVAPMSVMDPGDPQAKPIGLISEVPAGVTVLEPQNLVFTPTGRADLIAMMNNFKTPFNILVGTTIVISDGTQVPTGKLDAVVRVTAHAGL